MSRARHFSLNWKEKLFFESTLFLGVPRGVFPEKVSPALAKRVLQHPYMMMNAAWAKLLLP
jgi:hypothetical protein